MATPGRLAAHPYARLSRNRGFAAFWLAQTISLLGDRLSAIALSVLIFSQTNSPLLTGAVLTASFAPNLLVGPFAGVFADRWDRRLTMVVTDLARAGLVLSLPLVAAFEPLATIPVIFLVTSLGLFFQAAKSVVVPALVPLSDVEAATGAVQGAATVADLGGYPISAVVVGVLGIAMLPLAFVIDALSYLASALLLFRLPLGGRPATPAEGPSLRREFMAGWYYLRRSPALFENTILSAVVQTTVGAYLALMVVYSAQLASGPVSYPENYPLLQLGFGVGNLLGVSVLASLSSRVRRGRLILGGFLAMGLAFASLGLVRDSSLAFGVIVAIGITNMIWLIPASSLIPEQTPDRLIGRVTSWRFAIVDSGVIAGMLIASILAEGLSAGLVFLVFGIVACLATIIGAVRPAIANPPVVSSSIAPDLPPHGPLPGV